MRHWNGKKRATFLENKLALNETEMTPSFNNLVEILCLGSLKVMSPDTGANLID